MTSLTQKLIDATVPPKSGRLTLRDHDTRGLSIRITPSGARSWSYEFRSPITGRNTRITLGAGSLAEARARARELRLAVAGGRDPAIDAKAALLARQNAYSGAVTVADAIEQYDTAVAKPGARVASWRARMAVLRKAVEPFNAMAVADLKRPALMRRLDAIHVSRGPVAMNRSHSEIRAWQTWLHNRGLVETIELAYVKKQAKETARERVLTDAELAGILAATADRTPFSDIVRVLLVTGMRKGEAANLQARDLDFDAMTIRVRAEVAKSRQTRLIAMDGSIRPTLEERANRVGREQYVFGDGSDFRRPLSGWGRRTVSLFKAVSANEHWTLHDVRRTVATRLYEAGADALVVEDLLGHLSGIRAGIRGTYNRAQTLERQRPALRMWAEKLAALVDQGKINRNIVKLRKTR
jgi:integrase